MTTKKRDRWGRDINTGARGLEFGIRRVKNGMVKIAGELWGAVPGRGSLASYEGKDIEVSCSDAWASRYTARDVETFQNIATLTVASAKAILRVRAECPEDETLILPPGEEP